MTQYRLGIWDTHLSTMLTVVDECEAESSEVALLKMVETTMAGRPLIVKQERVLTLEEKNDDGIYDTVAEYTVEEMRDEVPSLPLGEVA